MIVIAISLLSLMQASGTFAERLSFQSRIDCELAHDDYGRTQITFLFPKQKSSEGKDYGVYVLETTDRGRSSIFRTSASASPDFPKAGRPDLGDMISFADKGWLTREAGNREWTYERSKVGLHGILWQTKGKCLSTNEVQE